ncbi:MAG: toll/interleukin-1 receptor domain-containing protein [Vicinamibacterales bacterium]
MADIFISYARGDRSHVERLAAHLERLGWTVWWDRLIHAGRNYDDEIQREIDSARAVIVLWSVHSVSSRWVRTEATEGLRREILVPVQLDESPVPLAFRMVHSVVATGLIAVGSRAFDDLIQSLAGLLGEPPVRLASRAEPGPAQEPAVETLASDPVLPLQDRAWPRKKIAAIAAIGLVLAVGGYLTFGGRTQSTQPPSQGLSSVPDPKDQSVDSPLASPPSALVESSASAIAASERAMKLSNAGRYGEALQAFRESFDESPNAVDAANVGFMYYRLSQYPEAIEWLQRSLEIDPNRAITYGNLGYSYLGLARYAEGRAALLKYVEMRPTGRMSDMVRKTLAEIEGK